MVCGISLRMEKISRGGYVYAHEGTEWEELGCIREWRWLGEEGTQGISPIEFVTGERRSWTPTGGSSKTDFARGNVLGSSPPKTSQFQLKI